LAILATASFQVAGEDTNGTFWRAKYDAVARRLALLTKPKPVTVYDTVLVTYDKVIVQKTPWKDTILAGSFGFTIAIILLVALLLARSLSLVKF
jgi:hypothetical protein